MAINTARFLLGPVAIWEACAAWLCGRLIDYIAVLDVVCVCARRSVAALVTNSVNYHNIGILTSRPLRWVYVPCK